VDVHCRKLQLLADNCRQSRADKLELPEARFSHFVRHGLHRDASKHLCEGVAFRAKSPDFSLAPQQIAP